MPFTDETYRARLSDLVVHEIDPSVGYSRRDINVDPGTELKIGAVVFRAKGSFPESPYSILTAGASIVDTNEFAIVFGDHFSFNPSFVTRGGGNTDQYNAVAFVGTAGGLQLKEYYIRQRVIGDAGLTEVEFQDLTGLLEAQGIQLLKTL